MRVEVDGITGWGHAGDIPGYATAPFYFPEEGFGVVVRGTTEGANAVVGAARVARSAKGFFRREADE